jgi:hypothetical protein
MLIIECETNIVAAAAGGCKRAALFVQDLILDNENENYLKLSSWNAAQLRLLCNTT